jgi:hypothetical protein
MCPERSDFSFSWGLPTCELFALVEKDEKVERTGCNAFMHWNKGTGGVPTREEAREYISKAKIL